MFGIPNLFVLFDWNGIALFNVNTGRPMYHYYENSEQFEWIHCYIPWYLMKLLINIAPILFSLLSWFWFKIQQVYTFNLFRFDLIKALAWGSIVNSCGVVGSMEATPSKDKTTYKGELCNFSCFVEQLVHKIPNEYSRLEKLQ